jgi:hypothetical protein
MPGIEKMVLPTSIKPSHGNIWCEGKATLMFVGICVSDGTVTVSLVTSHQRLIQCCGM